MAMGTAKAKVRQSKNTQAKVRNKVRKATGKAYPVAKVVRQGKTPTLTQRVLTPVALPLPKATATATPAVAKATATAKPRKAKPTPPPPTPKQLAKQRLQAKVSNGVYLPVVVGYLQVTWFMGVARYYKTHTTTQGYVIAHNHSNNTFTVFIPRTRYNPAQTVTATATYNATGITNHCHYIQTWLPLPKGVYPNPAYYPYMP